MTIFIAGDSTAASYTQDLAPLTGWGQVLYEFLPDITVENHSMAGRSSKSFLYEGRLLPIEEKLKPGDLLLIQFAHNDEDPRRWRHTEPWQGYMHALSIMVQTARLHGAVPVLVTPICIRSFHEDVLQSSHDGYLEAMHTLAVRTGTLLIDLYHDTFEYVQKLGDTESKKLYMHLNPGEWSGYPDGREDDTHTTMQGARAYAEMAAKALKEAGLCCT